MKIYGVGQGSRKCLFFRLRLNFEELDRFSLQKDNKNSVHKNLCFLIFNIKIYIVSGDIKTNKSFVNTYM